MKNAYANCDQENVEIPLPNELPAKRVCDRSINQSSLKARCALNNLTNRIEHFNQRSWASSQLLVNNCKQSSLTANAIVLQSVNVGNGERTNANRELRSQFDKCAESVTSNDACTRSRAQRISCSRRSIESGYGGSDTENTCSRLSSKLECNIHRPNFRGLTEFRTSGQFPKPSTIDDSEIDRRPFKPKLACDIVRAAFADRVQLEDLLAECRRADFAISAIDRSPIDRMMEATDYIVGIMAYEQIRETKDYFCVGDFVASQKQPNLTTDMLTTLADWLVEVQDIFAFNHETVHLAWGLLYAYFDRGQPLARREIQLMACAAIMVACKHEESKMPQLTEFLYITDGAYKREEFIEAERRLLVAIDFAVHRPNPYVFLRRYARVLDAHSGLVQYMSRFLLESGMHSHAISLKRESRKAAAVLWLSRVILRNPSYLDWARRQDVRQLRQFMRSNGSAQRYYETCFGASSSVHPPPNPLCSRVCPDSGALDLRTYSGSSNLSRTISLTHKSGFLAENLNDWIERNQRRTPLLFDRTASDPYTASPKESYDKGYASAPTECHCTSEVTDEDLGPLLKQDLQAMRAEEDQRAPYWPPILEHITGYKECDLIPLAIRYHAIALRLIAEVARGGCLASTKDCVPTASNVLRVDSAVDSKGDVVVGDVDDADSATHVQQRCISPGGHYLRRQAVAKYCSDDFLNVADAYPQLAFENFVPHFPAVQCPDSCGCFVCVNLVRR